MTARALMALLALACAGCSDNVAEQVLSKDWVAAQARQRMERKLDTLLVLMRADTTGGRR